MKIGHLLALVVLLAAMPASARASGQDDIIQLSPDTYILTRISRAGIFASMSKIKSGVIRDANAFAASRGKIAIPLVAKETPVGGPGQWPMFEYQFRVVDPSDTEARRTALVPRADMVIENNHHITREPASRDEAPKSHDIYGELIKLDDLHKKGILTDAEFQAQKQKILSAE